jgi:hypothetical protein
MSQIINLTQFADGAVAERFNQELIKVLENIADPNTDPKKVRKLTLTVSIAGNEKRDIATVGIQAKVTLSPAKQIETQIIMDYDNRGRVTGAELKSGIKGQTYVDVETGEIADDRGNKIINLKQQSN